MIHELTRLPLLAMAAMEGSIPMNKEQALDRIAYLKGKLYARKFTQWAAQFENTIVEWRANGVVCGQGSNFLICPMNTDCKWQLWRGVPVKLEGNNE